MKNADRISSAVLIGLSVFFFVESGNFSRYGKLFPRIIAVILGGLALLLLVMSFVRPKEGKVFDLRETDYPSVGIVVVFMIAWAFLIEVLGFLTASLLFFAPQVVYLDRKKTAVRILRNIGLVAVVVAGFYFFFVKVLLVPFPEGFLL